MIIVDVLAQDSTKGFAAYQKMAVAIAALMKSNGSCKPNDLLDQRFSHAEIAHRLDIAQCFACFDSVEA